ncbi:YncE family protein [Clostridium sp. BJN0013]|uniref:YncE family protein n=1 Tax=Clostridium sp. BJN0013 TaxID=3236840 RepID=UPI0034C6674A
MIKHKLYRVSFILVLFILFFSGAFITMEYRTRSLAKDANDSRSYYFIIGGKDTIYKMDSVTNQIVNEIKVEGQPQDIKVSADGSTLVVIVLNAKDENDEGYILFYNIKDSKFIRKIQVGKHPSRVAFTTNKKYIMVSNTESNNISLIDGKNYTILQSIAVGREPQGFCISKDGNYCYVANTGEDTVSVLDMTIFKSIKKIRVGRYPTDILLNKDNGNIMVTLSKEKSVALINPHTEDIQKVSLHNSPTSICN